MSGSFFKEPDINSFYRKGPFYAKGNVTQKIPFYCFYRNSFQNHFLVNFVIYTKKYAMQSACDFLITLGLWYRLRYMSSLRRKLQYYEV